ncbi:MAG: EF-Tu/IF-2/RF-3 family GTPase [Candidatus Micrarchaeia archaeon]
MDILVALPFDEELAKFIGKKGSENSITFYNKKNGNDVIVALMPNMEKFYSMLEVLTISDVVLASTKSIDKNLGEVIIACSLLGKHVLFTDDNEISKGLLSGINLDYEVIERNAAIDKLIEYGSKLHKPAGDVRVDIDKAFNVKGIGTVVLGIVTRGTVHVHDTLMHSSGKSASIRSIQSQDQDISEASAGTRVGLAIKGIDYSEIEKGDIFSTKQISPVKNIRLALNASILAGEQMVKGNIYGIGSNFSYSKATLESIEGNNAFFKLESQMPLEIGDKCLLDRQAVPRIFSTGTVKGYE